MNQGRNTLSSLCRNKVYKLSSVEMLSTENLIFHLLSATASSVAYNQPVRKTCIAQLIISAREICSN